VQPLPLRQRAHAAILWERALVVAPRLSFEQSMDTRTQQHLVERFEQIVIRAKFDASRNQIEIASAGDDSHWYVANRRVLVELSQYLEPAHIWIGAVEVDQDQTEHLMRKVFQCFLPVGGDRHPLPLALQEANEQRPIVIIVSNDQNVWWHECPGCLCIAIIVSLGSARKTFSEGDFALFICPCQESRDLFEQPVKIDRFGFEVVATDVHCAIPIFTQYICGKGNDRNMARFRTLFDPFGRLPSVQDRQSHIHEDQIGCSLHRCQQCADAIFGGHGFVSSHA